MAHQRYGVLDWSELFQPSIKLAEEGFVIGRPLAVAMLRYKDLIKADPDLRFVFIRWYLVIPVITNASILYNNHSVVAIGGRGPAAPWSEFFLNL